MTDARATQVGVEEFASTTPPELRATQAVVEEWAMVVTLLSATARMDGQSDMSAGGATFRAAAPALMAGQSDMSAAGAAFAIGAAHMDGQAQMLGVTVVTASGAAAMDGLSTMLAAGAASAVGAARMDGLAQAEFNSVDLVKGAAQMDGAGQLVGISVEGAAIAQMDGEASVSFTSPHYFNVLISSGIVGGQSISPLMTYKPILSQDVISHDVMKPKMRYHLTSSYAMTFSSAINFRMKFVKVLKEVAIMLTPGVQPHSQFHYDLITSLGMRPTLTPRWRAARALVESLLVDQTTSPKFIWGRGLTEALKVAASLDATTHYKTALAQLFKFTEIESFKLRHPVALTQDIHLSLSLIGGYGLKLLQKLLVASASSPALHYHLALTGKVTAGDTLEHLVSGILAELFTVHPVLDRQFIADSSLAQLLTVHPLLNNKLVLKIVGHIQVSPEQLASMIYRGDPLLDGVVITALYISPSGTTTTWVVNTRTNAVTEYDNYDFRSFAQMGDRYIAAGPEGLYELDGDTDDGTSIVSRMMSGYLQLNEKKMFGIKGAYVSIRGGGRFYLKLISGDGREYVYELKAQPNLMTTKVKVGKGIKTTYMAFELVTEGQDFDLDSIEFIPMTSGRRV